MYGFYWFFICSSLLIIMGRRCFPLFLNRMLHAGPLCFQVPGRITVSSVPSGFVLWSSRNLALHSPDSSGSTLANLVRTPELKNETVTTHPDLLADRISNLTLELA